MIFACFWVFSLDFPYFRVFFGFYLLCTFLVFLVFPGFWGFCVLHILVVFLGFWGVCVFWSFWFCFWFISGVVVWVWYGADFVNFVDFCFDFGRFWFWLIFVLEFLLYLVLVWSYKLLDFVWGLVYVDRILGIWWLCLQF